MKSKLKLLLLLILGILLISPPIVLPFIDIFHKFGIHAVWDVLFSTIMTVVFVLAGVMCLTYVITSIIQQRQYKESIEDKENKDEEDE